VRPVRRIKLIKAARRGSRFLWRGFHREGVPELLAKESKESHTDGTIVVYYFTRNPTELMRARRKHTEDNIEG